MCGVFWSGRVCVVCFGVLVWVFLACVKCVCVCGVFWRVLVGVCVVCFGVCVVCFGVC